MRKLTGPAASYRGRRLRSEDDWELLLAILATLVEKEGGSVTLLGDDLTDSRGLITVDPSGTSVTITAIPSYVTIEEPDHVDVSVKLRFSHRADPSFHSYTTSRDGVYVDGVPQPIGWIER